MKTLFQHTVIIVMISLFGSAYGADGERLAQSDADATALRHADGGTVTRRKARWKDGREVLDYVIVNDGQRIKLRLDAADGTMLKYERDPVKTSEGGRAGSGDEPGILSHEEAGEIALRRSGGGVVVESEREHKRDGRVLYEIEIHKEDMEYEMVVDGRNGRIVKYEEERRKR